MGSILNPPRSSAVRNRRPMIILVAVGVVGVIAAISFLANRVSDPVSFVDRVIVANPTPYHVEVYVIGAGRSHGVGLGAIEREQTRTFEDVIDQGREWIFRFSSGGYDGGEVRITQDQLQNDEWHFTVPAEVSQRLQVAGLAPSPAR